MYTLAKNSHNNISKIRLLNMYQDRYGQPRVCPILQINRLRYRANPVAITFRLTCNGELASNLLLSLSRLLAKRHCQVEAIVSFSVFDNLESINIIYSGYLNVVG